ncbi:MAG: hypothetical protein Q8N14_01715 [Candidatus Omnitrophota bacterium]|nr:hypothetical protein [Candidatus Omnitrophota bacterium]
MRLVKFIPVVGLVTIIALIYVQLQVQIYEYAYKGKRKEIALKELLDRKSNTMYNINSLESVQYLGTRLLSQDYNLQFAGKEQVVKLTVPMQLAESINPAFNRPENRRVNLLANLFTLKSQAEARPIK